QFEATDAASVAYWGTTSGEPLPEALQAIVRWSAGQIFPDYRSLVANWPRVAQVDVLGLGEVLFCHGTPRSEVECFTRLTGEHLLLAVFEAAAARTVICGHTHMQFDRMIGTTRVVNAGSVGMPFGAPGADWLLLGPGVDLRHTTYDLDVAARRIRATDYPQAEEFAAKYVLQPPTEAAMLEAFTSVHF